MRRPEPIRTHTGDSDFETSNCEIPRIRRYTVLAHGHQGQEPLGGGGGAKVKSADRSGGAAGK